VIPECPKLMPKKWLLRRMANVSATLILRSRAWDSFAALADIRKWSATRSRSSAETRPNSCGISAAVTPMFTITVTGPASRSLRDRAGQASRARASSSSSRTRHRHGCKSWHETAVSVA
jgi:hypothetical protein